MIARHFHPEFEIMLIQEGSGMRFVGGSMERFQAGDLVLLGCHVPHLFRSDQDYYQKNSGLRSKAIVIYFKEDFLGESFWKLSQVNPIKKLLFQSKRGIQFKGDAKLELTKQIQKIDHQKDGIGRIIDLLSILKTMSETKECDVISSTFFTKHSDEECERINKVYQFIIDNYVYNPSLGDCSLNCVTGE